MRKQTTLQHKLIMAVTGLFLCLYLVIHLLGNLQLLLPPEQARLQFNAYSRLLSGNYFIKAVSWILLLTLVAHAVYALIITRKNAAAAGIKYAHDRRVAVTSWASRNMGLLGTIILIFLVIHYKDFWYPYSFTTLSPDSNGNKDLYGIVVSSFRQLWYVLLYELSFIALGYHLLHGFFSAARTLGVFHPKYERGVRMLGKVYTAAITLGFMAIPIYVYFKL